MQDKDTFSRQFSPLAAGYVPGGLHWAAAESGDAPKPVPVNTGVGGEQKGSRRALLALCKCFR